MSPVLTRAVADPSPIATVADRLEPAVRQRFLDAIEGLRDAIDLDALARALASGNRARIEQAIGLDDLPDALRPFGDTLTQIVQAVGDQTAAALGAVLGQTLRFDLGNPWAAAWARRYSSTLIQGLTTETRDGVRALIAAGLEDGITVAETAQALRDLVGLTARQARAVTTYQATLVADGRDAEAVARLGARYGATLLRQRASLIARTETIAASTHGQLAAWRQAVAAGLLDPATTQRRWSATEDDRECPLCREIDGQTVAFDAPFSTPTGTIMGPPEHPGCRCSVGLVFAR